MTLTVTSALLMLLGLRERTGAVLGIMIMNQHVFLYLIVMQFQYMSLENLPTLVTNIVIVLKHMKKRKSVV